MQTTPPGELLEVRSAMDKTFIAVIVVIVLGVVGAFLLDSRLDDMGDAIETVSRRVDSNEVVVVDTLNERPIAQATVFDPVGAALEEQRAGILFDLRGARTGHAAFDGGLHKAIRIVELREGK